MQWRILSVGGLSLCFATITAINCSSSIDLIMRFKVACSRRNLKITFSAVHSSLIKKQWNEDREGERETKNTMKR